MTKWRGVIISIVFVIVSSLLISISYGKKGDCSTLIYDIGVSIFTGALLVMDRYIEILEKFEEDKKEEKELFCRLMSKLIVEERASLNEAKEQYPFDKFCVEDVDEVDKVALNGMIDLKMDSRLKVCDDYDFSHGTSWSTPQGIKKRYNIVDYYIFHILPKEKYFRISKDE